ncbi:MAG: RNA polymerase sigma factor [Planctomycetes bacterium]|nr:RNA polymerase sigma factor [Planctomycetota bacterium]
MADRTLPGDGDEFRRLFDEHRDTVFRVLYRLAGNRHDAEDLVQDTFVRLWRKREQFRGDGSVEGYLRRIAYRTFLNARARLSRPRAHENNGREPVDHSPDPSESASRAELKSFLLAHVRRAVEELPDSWREPFVLFRYEGMKLKEIADTLGITPKAAEIRVARALERVSGRLRELKAKYGEAL